MAQRIDMPSVGQTTDELVIVEWLKKEGDPVALGESLFSVQTDKAQVEVESIAAGTLLKVLRDAGETVRAGSPVAYVGAPGEAVPDVRRGEDGGDSTGVPTTAAQRESGACRYAARGARASLARETPGTSLGAACCATIGERARRRSDHVAGTGQDGVITVRDVELARRNAERTGEASD